ncbi:MAG: penicillin-binding protein activator [Deltaproteobacteria bacterium]|nr:penicillin-binding protein activator [Deltaproteobacteria bacterium]
MGYKNPLIKKAVLILVMGMAFLFFSCQGGRVLRPGTGFTGYQEAVSDFEAGRYETALRAFNKILKAEPDHPEIRMIRYYQAFCYYYTGEYKTSITLATDWMKDYPDSPERYMIQKLAGDASSASGSMYEACFWMTISLKTAKYLGTSEQIQEQIFDSILNVIGQSNEDDLEKIEQLDSITPFVAAIYLRRSELAFERGEYREAKSFAKLAIESAEENGQADYVTRGNEFISQINKKIDETSEVNRLAIGCLLPLQGPAALYGEELLNGIQLGMDIFNASDRDIPIELVIRNTNYSSEETLAAIDELIFEEKVIAVIGPLSSAASASAAKKAQEYGVPIITFTQKQDITEEGDMVFRNYLTPSRELDVLLNRAVKEMGMSRFGIFYPETSYGKFFMNLFWDRIEEMGCEITAVESYKSGDTDFSEGIKKMVGLFYPRPESIFEMIKAKKLANIAGEQPVDPENPDSLPVDEPGDDDIIRPGKGMSSDTAGESINNDMPGYEDTAERLDFEDSDDEQSVEAVIEEEAMTDPIVDFDAVFIPDNSQNIAQIAPQFPFNSVFNVPFLGTSLWLSDELISTTSDYLQGAMFPVGFYAKNDSKIVRDFVDLYRSAYGKDPGILAATGFDTIKLIKKLMRENDLRTRSDFQQVLLENDSYEGVTGGISFDDRGEVEKFPMLLTVHGRRLHILQ